MSDREEIIQLINLYGFAMDTQRWDLFDRVFTEDVDADYGPGSHWTDRAAFKRDFGVPPAAWRRNESASQDPIDRPN
jgi:AraC-like DNA-binding protein